MSGQDDEISELFQEHYPSLARLAYVVIGNASSGEEIVMEAFVKLYARPHLISGIENRSAYLRKVVTNLCLSQLRRTRLEQRVNAIVHSRDPVSETIVSVDREQEMDVWAEVKKLPDRQRVLIVLRYMEDMTEADIATVMQCSVGGVKSQLSKARARLEKSLSLLISGRAK